jgi:hypothetical protein
MPAAVCRTNPARNISLWLMIWASAGASLATGRKKRERRISVVQFLQVQTVIVGY